jgi:hypothetical protein
MIGSFPRDDNRVPITSEGVQVTKAIVTNSTAATAVVPIFTVTGSVKVKSLYGVVTTTLGSNQTAAHWRLNDQTVATQVISLVTGTTVSNAAVGSLLIRHSLVSVALKLSTAAAGVVFDPVAATAPDLMMPFGVIQKVGGILSQIEYVYTTNQNPTTGAITFYINYIPLTPTSRIDPA